MKLLLIGASGLLGRKLLHTVPSTYTLIPTFRKETNASSIKLDVTNRTQVLKVITEIKPDCIIHAASIGDIDYCEKNQDQAWKVNVEGTHHILAAAQKINASFIFFSSNAVFNGKEYPYNEESPLSPLNFYGKTKVEAEKLIGNYFPRSIIFRLTTMYGWNNPQERQNPATWLIERLSKRVKTPVVTDVYNNHLWVGQATDAVWSALKKKLWGTIFHIAGSEVASRFDFSQKVAGVFGLDKALLIPVTSDYFKKITPRAQNTTFTTEKMRSLLKITPLTIKKGLNMMKREYEK